MAFRLPELVASFSKYGQKEWLGIEKAHSIILFRYKHKIRRPNINPNYYYLKCFFPILFFLFVLSVPCALF
jgi:hypothetical protein